MRYSELLFSLYRLSLERLGMTVPTPTTRALYFLGS